VKTYKNIIAIILILALGCVNGTKKESESVTKVKHITAADILGNPEYLAISYGGYRQKTRELKY